MVRGEFILVMMHKEEEGTKLFLYGHLNNSEIASLREEGWRMNDLNKHGILVENSQFSMIREKVN